MKFRYCFILVKQHVIKVNCFFDVPLSIFVRVPHIEQQELRVLLPITHSSHLQ